MFLLHRGDMHPKFQLVQSERTVGRANQFGVKRSIYSSRTMLTGVEDLWEVFVCGR